MHLLVALLFNYMYRTIPYSVIAIQLINKSLFSQDLIFIVIDIRTLSQLVRISAY
jgi:hypothetical protein